jgi:hypothetical protein
MNDKHLPAVILRIRLKNVGVTAPGNAPMAVLEGSAQWQCKHCHCREPIGVYIWGLRSYCVDHLQEIQFYAAHPITIIHVISTKNVADC